MFTLDDLIEMIATRPTVAINGKSYQVKWLDELSLREHAEFNALSRQPVTEAAVRRQLAIVLMEPLPEPLWDSKLRSWWERWPVCLWLQWWKRWPVQHWRRQAWEEAKEQIVLAAIVSQVAEVLTWKLPPAQSGNGTTLDLGQLWRSYSEILHLDPETTDNLPLYKLRTMGEALPSSHAEFTPPPLQFGQLFGKN